jgi:hypothetical protein
MKRTEKRHEVGREAPMVITPSALRRFVKWILSGGRQT